MNLADYNLARDFIYNDIQREIDLAKNGEDAGNFLCALGLLCYTEFAGDLILPNEKSKTKKFKHFFSMMGDEYVNLINEADIYGDLRCGLAHKYFTEKLCVISMIDSGNIPNGLFLDEWSIYHFCVEKYFEDFKIAFNKLKNNF